MTPRLMAKAWKLKLTVTLIALSACEVCGLNMGKGKNEAPLSLVGGSGLVAGVIPGCGGRTVLLRLPGGENLLQAQPEEWATQVANTALPGVDAPWVQDVGQVVWLGPQSRFWADQTLVDAPMISARGWPPDPFLTQAPYAIVEHSARRLVLRGVHSPVSQLTLTKTWTALDNGGIRFEVEARNTGKRAVRKGLWFNLRAQTSAQVFVPVRSMSKVRRSGDAGVPVGWADGFIDIGLPTLRPGLERADEKFFLEPSQGVIAAAMPGGFLVIEFAPTAPDEVAEGHAPVEIYRLVERGGFGLLELEQHGPERTLAPGETMRRAETWRFLRWPEWQEGCFDMAFLRAWCDGR